MTKIEAAKAAKPFFNTYPSVNTFYVTEDGQFFEKPNDANAHATTLNKKEPVVHVIDRDAESEKPKAEAPKAEGEKQKAEGEKTQEEKDKEAAEKKAASIEKAKATKAKKAAEKAKATKAKKAAEKAAKS